jgi:uncharacterized delta-60 repeat protein
MASSFDIPRAVALDSTGRIVVAGESRPSLFASPDFAIARYDANGALDPTFGTGGLVFTNFGLHTSSPEERGKDVAIQADGKIVVVGNVRTDSNGFDFGIARYNDNGSLDTSFDGDGLRNVNIGPNDKTSSVVIQTDGKIVVGGSTGGSIHDFALLRLDSSGTLDTSFDSDGIVRHNIIIGDSASIRALALQGDGKIVAAGVSANVFSNPQTSLFAVSRYNTDGSLDNDFDVDGTTSLARRVPGPCVAMKLDRVPFFSAVGLNGPGFVTVKLRVTDECNLSHTDSATVNILNLVDVSGRVYDDLDNQRAVVRPEWRWRHGRYVRNAISHVRKRRVLRNQ